MSNFSIPTRNDVSPANQAIFDKLEGQLGFVPNLYATFANSDNALSSYLAFQGAKSSLKAKEREAINLIVSQVNTCDYCLAAHTALGKMNGYTDEQIIEIRQGSASFDTKLDALVKFAEQTTIQRGKPDASTVENFLAAGYTKENLIDAIVVIGDKIVSNFVHGVTQVAIDFPVAPALNLQEA